jgi:hypothetical protein
MFLSALSVGLLCMTGSGIDWCAFGTCPAEAAFAGHRCLREGSRERVVQPW